MCFSATASFTAGIVLSGIGIATLRKTHSRSQFMFASIPLIFSAQQLCEGVLWLAMTKPAYAELQAPFTFLFLFFAQVVWPIWVPLSILQLDPKNKRRLAQKIMVGVGGMLSLYLAFCILNFDIESSIVGHHIAYTKDYPASLAIYSGIFYVVATITPSFLSGYKHLWMLGTSILISYILAALFYEDSTVSVWCFFAAIISSTIYYILHHEKIRVNLHLKSLNFN